MSRDDIMTTTVGWTVLRRMNGNAHGVSRTLGHQVCFSTFFYFTYYHYDYYMYGHHHKPMKVNEGPRQQVQVNKGLERLTKAKRRLTITTATTTESASMSRGIFFFYFFLVSSST